MRNQLLFLAAVFVSLPMPVLADRANFQGKTIIRGSAAAISAVPSRVPSAVLFNGALTGAHVRTLQVGMALGKDSGREWFYTLSAPVFGQGESDSGSGVENRFDASSRSFSSLVEIDDGVISISVPEPATVWTLSAGLAMIGCLIRRKGRKLLSCGHFSLH